MGAGGARPAATSALAHEARGERAGGAGRHRRAAGSARTGRRRAEGAAARARAATITPAARHRHVRAPRAEATTRRDRRGSVRSPRRSSRRPLDAAIPPSAAGCARRRTPFAGAAARRRQGRPAREPVRAAVGRRRAGRSAARGLGGCAGTWRRPALGLRRAAAFELRDGCGFLRSIDLVIRRGHEFLIVDYKTNRLAPAGEELTAWHHRPAALAAEMARAHSGLQGLLDFTLVDASTDLGSAVEYMAAIKRPVTVIGTSNGVLRAAKGIARGARPDALVLTSGALSAGSTRGARVSPPARGRASERGRSSTPRACSMPPSPAPSITPGCWRSRRARRRPAASIAGRWTGTSRSLLRSPCARPGSGTFVDLATIRRRWRSRADPVDLAALPAGARRLGRASPPPARGRAVAAGGQRALPRPLLARGAPLAPICARSPSPPSMPAGRPRRAAEAVEVAAPASR